MLVDDTVSREISNLLQKQKSFAFEVHQTRETLKFYTDLCKTNPSSEIETLSRYSMDRITQLQVQLKAVRNKLKILNRSRYRPSRCVSNYLLIENKSSDRFTSKQEASGSNCWHGRPKDTHRVCLRRSSTSIIDALPSAVFTLIFPHVAEIDGACVTQLRQARQAPKCILPGSSERGK